MAHLKFADSYEFRLGARFIIGISYFQFELLGSLKNEINVDTSLKIRVQTIKLDFCLSYQMSIP